MGKRITTAEGIGLTKHQYWDVSVGDAKIARSNILMLVTTATLDDLQVRHRSSITIVTRYEAYSVTPAHPDWAAVIAFLSHWQVGKDITISDVHVGRSTFLVTTMVRHQKNEPEGARRA